MATVTGFTAERMQEIEDAAIVDGDIVGDNLILTRHDGTQINAGNVRGPVGPAGPASATLDAIGDVDTTGVDIGDVLMWNGTNWVAGTNIKVQTTAPTGPDLNDLWVDIS